MMLEQILTPVLLIALIVLGLYTTTKKEDLSQDPRLRLWVQNASIGVVLMLAICIGFLAVRLAASSSVPSALHAARIVALGLLAVGAVVGFLFGLPTVVEAVVTPPPNAPLLPTEIAPPNRLKPNTNLQKVSDWLTTVITGIALSQLIEVPANVGKLSAFLAGGLGSTPDLQVLALGVILYFPMLGFLTGYIATRVLLTPAFDDADRTLTWTDKEREIVDATPQLLEVPDQPTDADREAAKRIVAADPSKLVTADQKATYARAKMIRQDYAGAIDWFQRALALDPENPRLLEQYAAALYADPSADSWQVVNILTKALGLTTDLSARARVTTNLILAYLYVRPSGFLQALALANSFIVDQTMPKKPLVFFYRACANGQLYRAIKMNAPVAGDLPTRDLNAISDAIKADTQTALTVDPTLGARFLMVIEPKPAEPEETADDDLAVYATDCPEYRVMLGAPPTAPEARAGNVAPQTPAKTAITQAPEATAATQAPEAAATIQGAEVTGAADARVATDVSNAGDH